MSLEQLDIESEITGTHRKNSSRHKGSEIFGCLCEDDCTKTKGKP